MQRKNEGEEMALIPQMPPSRKVYREDNTVFFYDDFDVESVYLFEKHMRDIYQSRKVLYVNVVIDSFGGHLCGVYDFLKSFPLPTVGWIRGYCCSAASTMLLGCTRKIMSPSSLMLIHSFQGPGDDYVREGSLRDEHDNIVKQNNILRSIYKKETKIPPKELDALLKDRERFLTAQECKKWKIIDEIATFVGV